jgi:release factor glutamine methyltransferase
VARILGQREFFGRMFAIDPTTLDPRPDTETVIEAALAIADEEGWHRRPIRILDIGTGSGCLLLTLIAELPLATGLGTDISAGALKLAAENAARLGVADRVRFAAQRSLEGFDGPFDLMVSNPPYIPSGEIAGLEPEVRDFDPRTALDGGADGLTIYRELAQGCWRIVPDGWVILEVGAGQSGPVSRLFLEALKEHASPPRIRSDLGGHDRCVAIRTHQVLMTH